MISREFYIDLLITQATVVVDSLWEVVQLSLLKVRLPVVALSRSLSAVHTLSLLLIWAAVYAGHISGGVSRGHCIAAQ